MSTASEQLLSQDDPAPLIQVFRPGKSPFVFCCDHAGALVPAQLADLGLDEEHLNDHIGVDIGIFAVTSWLSGLMLAPMVAQPYSRLVIDNNRRPGNPTSIPAVSDARAIPGNEDLDDAARLQREQEILMPYQEALGALLRDQREVLGQWPILMTMHSFTRRMKSGARREVDIGVIYEGESAFAAALQKHLANETYVVRRNEPYSVGIEEDFTVPLQAIAKGIPYVEIEICQDLIETCAGQRRLASTMRRAMLAALREIEPMERQNV
ncbi:N-formylglutamate amidohydrolase [Celeribacter litoreus]|uniref:N-formylglutamate amidohydrolase n=1 Tax=Celeribacter litoreus TaxID=2876714 RepID=UPI001CCA6A0C|nr:N-formylglutamate amidohydrolase [Celeribacter litoreus]MCA0042496.1 N-formylglutamate amidohydrolase [Celeribacter litoreus]